MSDKLDLQLEGVGEKGTDLAELVKKNPRTDYFPAQNCFEEDIK